MRACILLLLLLGAGCRKAEPPAPREVRVPVRLLYGGVPIGCGAPPIAGCDGTPGGPVAPCGVVLHDVRLFVSAARAVSEGGELAVPFVADGRRQTAEVALLDFGIRDGVCEAPVAAPELVLSVPADVTLREVRLTVGVPFALNHANPALAQAPLTAGAMHWSWRGGYKFVRVEAAVQGVEARVHLGSTGCEGAIGAITRCASPGHVDVHAPVGPAGISLDLAPLLASAPGGDGDCMGASTDADCAAATSALGARVFGAAR